MKKLLILSFCIFSFSKLFAQGGGCGTVLSPQQEAWLSNFQQTQMNLTSVGNPKAATKYVPVRAHIVGDENGNGYYPVRTMLEVICELNVKYAPVDFIYYLHGNIDFINDSSFYHNGSSSNPVAVNTMSTHNEADVLNVYFVQASPGLCGYYTYANDCVVIIGSCGNLGGTTITHEFGHFFSLPHTFKGWEGTATPPLNKQEKVNGTNCATAGDGFCDTPADYISVRWNCPYTGTRLDQTGTPYAPDETLYMSYSSDVCQNQFSPQQIQAMRANATSRAVMFNRPAPNTNPVTGICTNTIPTGFVTGLNPASTTFTWSKPAGADLTYLSIAAYPSGVDVANIFTADTFYTATNLKPNTAYQWKVKALNAGNTCGYNSYSIVNKFFTGDAPSGIATVNKNITMMSLYPNPVNGSADFENVLFQSNKVETATVNCYNLTGQIIFSKEIETKNGYNELQIPISNLASGMYLVKVATASTNSMQKFIIE